jgi:hypothetical protein
VYFLNGVFGLLILIYLITDPLWEKWELQAGQDLQIWDGDEADISSSPTNASFSPPTTVYKLQHSINKVEAQLNEIETAIPGSRRSLTKIFSGSLTQAIFRRLKELREAPLGSMPPALSESEERAIDRNIVLNIVEQAHPRRSDPNLIRCVEDRV